MAATVTAVTAATANHFAIGTVDQRGRVDRVAKTYVSKENLKNLAVTALSAAITAGISHEAGVKTTNMKGFEEQLKGNAVKGVGNFAANAAVRGKPGQALKNAAAQVGVDTVTGTIANKIGADRKVELEKGDTAEAYALHKAFHGLLGAARGAATGALQGKRGEELTQATLGGAIGAVTAEIFAEGMRGEIADRVLKRAAEEGPNADINQVHEDELARVQALAQLVALATAKLCKADIDTSVEAVRNAIDNNFFMVLWPVVVGAMKLYDIITTCQGAWEAYEQGGLQALVQYGLEEATMNLLMSSGMKIVTQTIKKARTTLKGAFAKGGEEAAERATKQANVPASEGKASTHRNTSNEVSPKESAKVAERACSKDLQVNENKFDYLFGKVSSNKHNADRSQQLVRELSHVGIHDNAAGRVVILDHLEKIVKDPSNIVNRAHKYIREGARIELEVRHSLFAGPGGFLMFESTFEIRQNGTRRLVTIVPKRGK